MNLSKVYSTEDTFTPEDLIQARLHGPPHFGDSLITATLTDREPHRPEFTMAPPRPEEVFAHDEPIALKDDRSQEKVSTGTSAPADADPPEAPVQPAPVPPPPPGVATAEVERLVAEAYARGFGNGRQQAEEDYGTATAALLLICQQMDILRETILKNSVGEIQDLVLAIAEKIIRHSVQEQSTTIVDTVEEAIHKAVKSEEFHIFVNPDDYAVVDAKSKELVAGLNGLNSIIVKKDRSIERGGCRIDSDNCTVDATVASQLDIIRDQLRQD